MRRWLTIVMALLAFSRASSGQDFTINKIVGNLNQPTFVAFAPGDDNDLYIAELRSGANVNNLGDIVRYNRVTHTKTTIIDFSSNSTTDDGGVVGIAFHPDYQTNGLFYVDYNRAENNGTTGYDNYIQEYHMNADGTASLTSRGTILKYPTLNNINYHTVDWIGFDPTANGDARNYLYVTTGDGGPNIGTGYATSTILPTPTATVPIPLRRRICTARSCDSISIRPPPTPIPATQTRTLRSRPPTPFSAVLAAHFPR